MIDQIQPAEVAQWLHDSRSEGAPVILDVREPDELRIASLDSAAYPVKAIPMGSIPSQLQHLDPEQPIACLCHHGRRSMQVAMYLHSQGFSKVVNIAGGIHAWSTQVDPSIPCY